MVSLYLLDNALIECRLKNFFKTAFSPEANKDKFPWDLIPLYFEKHVEDVIKSSNPNIFCDFFVEVLEKSQCESNAIVTFIADMLTVSFLESEMSRSVYEDFFRCKKKDHIELITFFLCYNRNESVFPNRECVQVINALETGNYRLMQILATYGCPVNISENSFFARRVAAIMIRKIIWLIEGHRELRRGPNWNFEQLNTLPCNLSLLNLRDDPLWRSETVSFQRLFLLTLGIYAFSLKLRNKAEFVNYVKCLDIYFRTIREPYLTVIEIKRLLIIDFIQKHKEYLFDELCEVFKNAVPFCTNNFEPRSLCHLARCQVRQNLCNSGNSSTLPAVLDQMKMPKQMKEFLLCEPSTKNVFQNNL